ncbi:MAG TPA: O-antigen ligase family protein [Bryobacteraceae bacterium]|nr:O-antigen ligase family protein [Bryobacteraceae bacterium]
MSAHRTSFSQTSLLWPVALWAALLAGILVAWSPRYWAVAVAISAISIVTICRVAFALPLWTTGVDVARIKSPERLLQFALLLLIGGWGYLQIAFHRTVLPQLTLDSSIVWALSAACFVLGTGILRERAARDLFLSLLMWSLSVLAVLAMFQFYGNTRQVFGLFPADEAVFGTFLSRNQFAALMELAAPIALWHMFSRNAVAGALCYAMILAATITASSRAGVILVVGGTIVSVCMVLFTGRREAKVTASILVGLAVLVGVAAGIAGTDQIRARFEDKNPLAVRRELRDSTVRLIAERPISGYGMGTWRAVYPHVATFDLALLANEAHNDWVQWAAEGGIPFAIFMAALVIRIAKPAVQSIWGLGLLCVAAHSYFDYPLREPVLSFLWFALAGAVAQFHGRGRRRTQHPRESVA